MTCQDLSQDRGQPSNPSLPLHPLSPGWILALPYGYGAQTLAEDRTERQGAHPAWTSTVVSPQPCSPPSAITQTGSSPAASPSPPAALRPAQLRSDLPPPSPPHVKASDSCPRGTSRARRGPTVTRGFIEKWQRRTGRRCPSPLTGPGGFVHRCGNYLRMGSTQQLPGTRVAARQDHQHPITSLSQ